MFRTWKRRIRYARGLMQHRRVLKRLVDSHLYFLEHRDVTVWGGISERDERGLRWAVDRAGEHGGPIIEIGALFAHHVAIAHHLVDIGARGRRRRRQRGGERGRQHQGRETEGQRQRTQDEFS